MIPASPGRLTWQQPGSLPAIGRLTMSTISDMAIRATLSSAQVGAGPRSPGARAIGPCLHPLAGAMVGSGGTVEPGDLAVQHGDQRAQRGEEQAAAMLAGERGYAAIRQLPGIGPVLGAVIAAEIGEITRFRNPGQLASWAGLTPRHYESDTRVIRGRVSKQGSRMLRWALVEAIQLAPTRQPARTNPAPIRESQP